MVGEGGETVGQREGRREKEETKGRREAGVTD